MSRRVRRVALWIIAPVLLASVLFALSVLWPLPPATPVRTKHPLAFVGATLVDAERGIAVPGRTILIDRGRIAAVGRDGTVALPAKAVRIDARGKYLMPAPWDMHAHVFATSPLLELPLYIAYGVTNVRDMQGCPKPGDPFIAYAEDKRRWTREAQGGLRVGPEFSLPPALWPTARECASAFQEFRTSSAPRPPRRGAPSCATTQRRGWMQSRSTTASRDAYFALLAEAKRLNLDVVGHRPLDVSAVEAAAAGQKSIEHGTGMCPLTSHAGQMRTRMIR